MLHLVEYKIDGKTKIKGYFNLPEEATTWAKKLNLKPSEDYSTSLKEGTYKVIPKF